MTNRGSSVLASGLSNGVAALALLVAALCAHGAEVLGSRVEVPITRTVLSNGEARYSIPVRIGHSGPIDAMLDTGSIGLRVLADALSAGDYSPASRESDSGYGTGVRVTGDLANANVSIGDAATDGAVPIQIVRHVGCFASQPRCPASRVSQSDYRFGGDGLARQGFKAIIGVAFWPDAAHDGAINPLGYIGARRWIIELPRPHESAPGRLILNPDTHDLAGQTLFDDLTSLPSQRIEAITGCLLNDTTGARFCGPVLFDTGSTAVHVWTSLASPQVWSAGTRERLVLNGGHSGAPEFKFETLRPSMESYVVIGPPLGPPGHLPVVVGVGPLAFFEWSVLYDLASNRMGLKPRM